MSESPPRLSKKVAKYLYALRGKPPPRPRSVRYYYEHQFSYLLYKQLGPSGLRFGNPDRLPPIRIGFVNLGYSKKSEGDVRT